MIMTKSEWQDKYSCDKGFDEFLVVFNLHCDDDDFEIEASVDVCADEVDKVRIGNKQTWSISDTKLTEVIRERPKKIQDIYVYASDEEDKFDACEFKLHETNNRLFRSLDRSTTIEKVGSGELEIINVLENEVELPKADVVYHEDIRKKYE